MSRIFAPAKLTVTLAVTGVRADGYHELEAEMVALSLADELMFTEGQSGLTVVADPGTRAESLPDQADNLISRALGAVGRTAAVEVIKRIPLGGGLGGGSTDAAAVLRWAGCDDPQVAVRLGADVPFSLFGGRALVEGVGERITPLEFETRSYLLLVPPFGVDTAAVYRAWDQEPSTEGPNALTAAALRVEPRLAQWRDALGDLTGREPTLAGSGSTWFVARDGGPMEEAEPWLERDGQRARVIGVHTVRPGWAGD